MYWLTRIDSINNMVIMFFTILLLVAIAFVVLGIDMRIDFSDDEPGYRIGCRLHRAVLRIILPIQVVLSIVIVAVPSTKEMAAIIIVPRLANSEKVQTVGNKVYDLAMEWLDTIKPEKKGDAK